MQLIRFAIFCFLMIGIGYITDYGREAPHKDTIPVEVADTTKVPKDTTVVWPTYRIILTIKEWDEVLKTVDLAGQNISTDLTGKEIMFLTKRIAYLRDSIFRAQLLPQYYKDTAWYRLHPIK